MRFTLFLSLRMLSHNTVKHVVSSTIILLFEFCAVYLVSTICTLSQHKVFSASVISSYPPVKAYTVSTYADHRVLEKRFIVSLFFKSIFNYSHRSIHKK